ERVDRPDRRRLQLRHVARDGDAAHHPAAGAAPHAAADRQPVYLGGEGFIARRRDRRSGDHAPGDLAPDADFACAGDLYVPGPAVFRDPHTADLAVAVPGAEVPAI